jgi:serine/threonine protein phosphatase PrpC
MASSLSSFSSSSSRAILSHAASQQKLSAGLGRKGDFVMVTANVDAAVDGGTVMRKVVFSAKGREGTLSITGGRAFGGASKLRRNNSHRRERGEQQVGDGSGRGSHSDSDADSSRGGDDAQDGFGGMAPVSEEGSESGGSSGDEPRRRRRATKRRSRPAHASDAPAAAHAPAAARADSGAGSTSASATGTDTETPSDDEDYAGVTTLDDMTGTSLALGLGDALADLAGAPQHGADDAELQPLTPDEEREWQRQRARGLIATWPAGRPVAPADVAQELEADIQASAAAKSSRGLLGLRATRSNTVPKDASSASSDSEDEGGSDEDVSVAGGTEDDDWGLSKPVKAAKTGTATARAGSAASTASARASAGGGGGGGASAGADAAAAQVRVVPPDAWNSCRSGSTFVSCPLGANAGLGLVYGEAHSRGLRATMEDRCVAVADLNAACGAPPAADAAPAYAFFAVYDGHNGTGTCDALAQDMHFRLAQHLRLLPDAAAGAGATAGSPAAGGGAGTAEFSAFARACAEIDARLVASVQLGEPISGSTAIMVLARQGAGDAAPTLVCANVGDSRAVVSRSGHKLDLSFDHKVTRTDERARIKAAGGTIIKDRLNGVLAVSRAFGDAEHKRASGIECWNRELTADPLSAEPEVTHEPVHPHDEFAVLACDGVFDVMTSQQVVNFVRRRLLAHRDARRAAAELVEKAVALHTIDNVSAIIVAFTSVPGSA